MLEISAELNVGRVRHSRLLRFSSQLVTKNRCIYDPVNAFEVLIKQPALHISL